MDIHVEGERPGRVAAVIPAAGSGSRVGGPVPKQFLEIAGNPLLAVTLEVFERAGSVDSVFVVVPPGDVLHCLHEIVENRGFGKVARVVPGGETRRDSVRLGIWAAAGFEIVVVHDGVRPLVTAALVEKVIEAARVSGSATAGVPAGDTVKLVENGVVAKTIDREKVWLAQTPQAFRYDIILEAHERACREGWPEPTDDASLVEWMGVPVVMVPGDENNMKITTQRDMELLSLLAGAGGERVTL